MAAAAVAGESGERLFFFLSPSSFSFYTSYPLFRQLGTVITYLLLEKVLPMWDKYLPVFQCYEITYLVDTALVVLPVYPQCIYFEVNSLYCYK